MSAGPVSVLPVDSLRTPAPVALPLETAANKAASDRLALLDAVRLVAAVGIVWVHAAQSDAGKVLWPIGTFGVPFYTFVAVLFMTRTLTKPGGRSLGEYAVSRATRVYLPFLFWSGVYVMMSEAKTIVQQHTMHVPSYEVLYAGGQQHLWFLPFLMVVTLIGAVLVRGLQQVPSLRWPIVVMLSALGVVAAMTPEPAWVATRGEDLEFWRFTLRAAPTVFWSLALALATAFGGKMPRTNIALAVIGFVVCVASLVSEEAVMPLKVFRSIAGLGVVMIALLPLAVPGLSGVGKLGRYSYGIYLSHVMFLRIVADWLEHRGVEPTLKTDILGFVIGFGCATGLSLLLARSKWTKWVLGE